MSKDAKISSIQLGLLIIGFVYGDFALINPAKGAAQDGWLAFVFGWIGGFILIGMYAYISLLNSSKSLVGIIRDCFGKYLGAIITLLYIWYFLHLSSVVHRTLNEYMVTTSYTDTPMIFISIVSLAGAVYAIKKGVEVFARVSELLVPLIVLFSILIIIITIQIMKPTNLLPILSNGIKPVINTGFSIVTFPFGETIAFLMIFPFLNDRKKLVKTSFIALSIIGTLLLVIILREIMVLGPDMFSRHYFPGHTSASMVPDVVLEPLIAANLFIGSGFQITLFMFCAILAIAELFNMDDYKPIVFPVATIIIPLSIWIYDDFPALVRISSEVYPYYAIPFQVVIPGLLLIISLIKNKRKKNKNYSTSS